MKTKFNELHFDSIDSTNLYVKHHYLELDGFTFVSSDYQTNGRGRNDRVWKSEKGDNLLFSLLVKEKDIVVKGGYLSLVVSVSIASVLEKKYKLKNVGIKWPNDVYVGDKKICGILLEGQIPEYVVIGVGLNVNQKEFIGDYIHTPTSISLELGQNIEILQIKRDLYEFLLENLQKHHILHDNFYDYFIKHNYLKNKEISFILNGEFLKGKVLDIDKNFNLIIEANNQKITLSSGEVSLIKI